MSVVERNHDERGNPISFSSLVGTYLPANLLKLIFPAKVEKKIRLPLSSSADFN